MASFNIPKIPRIQRHQISAHCTCFCRICSLQTDRSRAHRMNLPSTPGGGMPWRRSAQVQDLPDKSHARSRFHTLYGIRCKCSMRTGVRPRVRYTSAWHPSSCARLLCRTRLGRCAEVSAQCVRRAPHQCVLASDPH